jgi:hypothetical protein
VITPICTPANLESGLSDEKFLKDFDQEAEPAMSNPMEASDPLKRNSLRDGFFTVCLIEDIWQIFLDEQICMVKCTSSAQTGQIP